jgi:distribution and morphology protein 31
MLVGTSRRNAGYLARHSSLGSNVARYTSIRAFFSQQALTTSNATAPPITPFLQARTRGHLVRFDLHIRAFSFTSIRPLEKGPGSAKEELASRSRTEDTKGAPLPPDEPPIPPQSNIVHYPQFIQNLIAHTPHLHRPTRDELLSVATGFWQRFRIRFKWFTIRSFRKFNADDISAFVTLLLFSQTVWMLVGT